MIRDKIINYVDALIERHPHKQNLLKDKHFNRIGYTFRMSYVIIIYDDSIALRSYDGINIITQDWVSTAFRDPDIFSKIRDHIKNLGRNDFYV